ncbi:MAG: hypothetical protein ACOYYS_17100 [Chloroflexota bacterium]
MRHKIAPLCASLLLFLATACNLPLLAASPTPNQGLETIVAATLTAFPRPAQPTATATLPTAQSASLVAAYVKDGNVYTWIEGGGTAARSSTNDAVDVRISDDGQVIAFLRESPDDYFHQELWAANTHGAANPRVLVSAADFDALKPDSPNPSAPGLVIRQFEFRPGTHTLAYNTAPRFEGPGSLAYEDLRLLNVDNGMKATLFEFGQGGIFTYAPDGNQIALVKPTSISLVDADGSNLRPNVLTFPSVTTYSEYQYYPKPHWAADASFLRVTIPPAEAMNEPLPPTTLWHIPTDGSAGVQIGEIPAMPFDWPDNAFSPDLERLAYIKQVGEPDANLRELHLANADGSNDAVLYEGEALSFLHWLPDSMQFVFRQFGTGNMHGVHIAQIDGATSTLTTNPESLRELRWITPERFLATWQTENGVELRLHTRGASANSFLIDVLSDFPAFDFTH